MPIHCSSMRQTETKIPFRNIEYDNNQYIDIMVHFGQRCYMDTKKDPSERHRTYDIRMLNVVIQNDRDIIMDIGGL